MRGRVSQHGARVQFRLASGAHRVVRCLSFRFAVAHYSACHSWHTCLPKHQAALSPSSAAHSLLQPVANWFRPTE